MKSPKNIICCGNIAYDLIQQPGPPLTFTAWPGGSVFNTAIQLSRLGINIKMLTRTGKDPLGDRLIEIMKKEKIDSKHAYQEKIIQTGLAFAKIDRKGNSSYVFYKTIGPQTCFKDNETPPSLWKDTLCFHTASMYSYEDYSYKDALKLISLAKKKKLFTTFDPNWRENRIKNKTAARKRIKRLMEFTTLLKLSATDALGITTRKTLSSALKALPPHTVVTLGEKGSLFWDGKKRLHQKAFKVKVTDTIGAGDAFTSGLLYRYYTLGKEAFWTKWKENLRFASAVSSIICTGAGATSALKGIYQINRFLKGK